MAFAIANTRVYGLGGGLRRVAGTWSGAVGDAAGTMSVMGSRVLSAEFRRNDSGSYADKVPVLDVAGAASGTRDLTIYNNADVTSGAFCIDILG